MGPHGGCAPRPRGPCANWILQLHFEDILPLALAETML